MTSAKKSKARAMPALPPPPAPCLVHSLQNEDWSAETHKVKDEQMQAFYREYDKVNPDAFTEYRVSLHIPCLFPPRSHTSVSRKRSDGGNRRQLANSFRSQAAAPSRSSRASQDAPSVATAIAHDRSTCAEDNLESMATEKSHLTHRSDPHTDSTLRPCSISFSHSHAPLSLPFSGIESQTAPEKGAVVDADDHIRVRRLKNSAVAPFAPFCSG